MPRIIAGALRVRLAFTMIELLVAIVIVGVTATLLVPAISAARGSAGQAACQANQMTISMAMHAYGSNYNNFLPPVVVYNYAEQLNGFPARYGLNYYNNPPQYGYLTFQMFLWPYADNRSTWIDPAHANFPNAAWDGGNSGTGIPNYDPVGSVDGQFWWMNYGGNPLVVGAYFNGNLWQRADSYTNTSATMAVTDNGCYYDANYDPLFDAGIYYTPGSGPYGPYVNWIDPLYDAGGPWGPSPETTRTIWVSLWGYDPAPAGDPWTPQDANLGRHPGKQVNSLMLDGHVQANNASYLQQAATMLYGYVPTDPNVTVFYTGQQR